MSLALLLLFLLAITSSDALETRQSLGTKGKFFSHILHSASFFPQTVEVEWKATLKGKPLLPVWMTLAKSKHGAISYLIGTPVGRQRQLTIHVIAKRLDTFQIAEQFVVITLQDDSKYTRSTQETLDVFVRNQNVEDLITDRSGLIGRMETAVKDTFKGKNVNPYIHGIVPAYDVKKTILPLRNQNEPKVGSIVSIGTQRRFSQNVHNMVASIKKDRRNCAKKNMEGLDRHFSPTFDIDWCKTAIRKITLVRDLADEETEKEFKNQKAVDLGITPEDKKVPTKKTAPIVEGGYSFFESVLVFPFIAVLCILLVLCLSAIFFGCREGQQWRDYKTPNEQLEEYASVREGQRKLRDLSVQRQVLLRSEEKGNTAPSDIHTFLQPKALPRYPGSSLRSSRNIINKSRSQLNDNGEVAPPPIDSIPLGKQTVAEAAKACGSSLHLYRNPLDTESDNEDHDSLDDGVIESA